MNNQRQEEFKVVDNPINFKYNISEAKTQMERWKKYINIFGWIFLIYGLIRNIGIIADIIYSNENIFGKDKPFGYDGTSHEIWPIVIVVEILSLLENISYIYLGRKWNKISISPTNSNTWKLCKTALYVAIFNILTNLIKLLLSLSIASNLIINSYNQKNPSTQPANNSGTANQNNDFIIKLTNNLILMTCLYGISSVLCYNQNRIIKIFITI